MSWDADVVEIDDTPTRIDNIPDSGRSPFQTFAVYNEGPGTVYLGGASVTPETGWPVAADEKIAFGDIPRNGKGYAVSDTTATLRLLDLGV